jgi:hypothetical protein
MLFDPALQAITDVLAERRRQVEVEGWTPEHDDKHSSGAMAMAAACYALAERPPYTYAEILWKWTGWADKWFKPKGHRRNLVKAGALILAEIERIDRETMKGEPTPE